MTVWDDVIGQDAVVRVLSAAVTDPSQLTHAWLFTGPPGSGRSIAARAFGAALQCPHGGCGSCRECRTALDGTHADVTLVATEGIFLRVDQARELVPLAGRLPSVGQWRVIVVEDADRLRPEAADALLKSLEEPTPRTVWMLCAPSPDDVPVTIRSRCRAVRLRTPPVEAVADLLVRRDGIDRPMALYAARAAQSHVGLARRLATDEGARRRRRDVIRLAGQIRGVGDAVGAAAELAGVAAEESKAVTTQRNDEERQLLLRSLGADPSARTQPPAVRSQLSALDKDQKLREKRIARDALDRSLLDLTSAYRDALMLRLGAPVALVNEDMTDVVERLAQQLPAERLLACMDAIATAREHIAGNAAVQLAMEAMALTLQLPR